MSELETLPEGWGITRFQDLFISPQSEIVDGPFGSNLKASEYTNTGIPLARLQNISRGQFVTKNMRYVSEDKADDLARHNFVAGDILISKLGDPLGEACIAPESIERGVLVADVVRARITHEWLSSRFLTHQINSGHVIEQFKSLTKGTTRPRVNLTKIRDLNIYLCPRDEQTRIVEKLEELLSDLDNGVAELKAAQTKLSQYRQSLLKSAVEGSLTAEWRQQNPATETGEQLLQRILTERRHRWEQQKLAEFKEKGKTPPKDWQKKYPEPVQPNITNLPELPEGWVWASVDQLAEIGTGVTPLKSRNDFYNKGTIPWVTSGAVNNEIIKEGNSFVTETAVTECRLKLYPAGTLLVAMYGEGKTRGKCSELSFPATINQALAALVMEESASCVKEHLKIFLLDSYQKMRSQASGGVQPNLNLLIVRSMCVPLPPIEEQQAISNIVSQQREDIESQRQTVNFSLQAIEAQRKNILKDAFSGKLVKQDPNDDSASVLLEKIKAEREARASQPKLKQVKKKLKTMKNIDIQSLKDWITKHNKDSFKFTDIESGLSADYDLLKELVFVALSESNPVFAQRFDDELGEIVFEKVST